MFAGLPRQCGAFLVAGERAALIDTGPSVAAGPVLAGLESLGVESLDHILLTHFHLDHAGAVPELLERWPEARVHVAERSIALMANPGRMGVAYWRSTPAVCCIT